MPDAPQVINPPMSGSAPAPPDVQSPPSSGGTPSAPEAISPPVVSVPDAPVPNQTPHVPLPPPSVFDPSNYVTPAELQNLDNAAVKHSGDHSMAGKLRLPGNTSGGLEYSDSPVTRDLFYEKFGGNNARYLGVRKGLLPTGAANTAEVRFTYGVDFGQGFTQILLHGRYAAGALAKGARMVNVIHDGGSPFVNLKTDVQTLIPGWDSVTVTQDGNDLVITVVSSTSPNGIRADIVTSLNA